MKIFKIIKKVINTILYHLYFFKLIKKKVKGINLGAGEKYIKGFYNIDANFQCECDIIAGIEKIKLARNSIETIYNSHVFEHIPRNDAQRVLFKWHKVLKEGGKLYICVPDVERLFDLYLKNLPEYGNEENKQKIDLITGIIYGGQTNKYDFHFNGYSFITLKTMLESVGFKEVKKFDYKKLNFGDASKASIEGIPVSLNIEATKI